MGLQFQVWLAPDSHKVQGLGGRNRKPVLRFPVWVFLKMTTASSVKKRTESIVSRNGSPAKHLTRHKKWTETRAAERRAGLLSGAKGSACARCHTSNLRAEGTVSVWFFCFVLCAWENIWNGLRSINIERRKEMLCIWEMAFISSVS